MKNNSTKQSLDKHIVSYPDELELNKPLTVIAGPNGYGKK